MRATPILGAIFGAWLCAQAAAAQTPWPADCKLTPVAHFPMTQNGGHVLVPVTVNGKTLSFIVDTGGYATSINRDAAAALNLKTHGVHLNRIQDVGGKDAASFVVADTFQLGRQQAKDFQLVVTAPEKGEDGVLAPDLLRNYDVELDFNAMTLTLFRPHPCSDWAVYWTRQYISVPITVTDNGHIRVDVSLDGKGARAVLDTGAGGSLLSLARAGALFDLDDKSPDVKQVGEATGALGGKVATYSYPFKSLAMGGVNVANPNIFLTSGGNFIDNDNASLLMGMNVLRRLHLYIDYHRGNLYLSDAAAN